MSEAKHAPGPWYFDGPATSIIVWSGPRERVCFMASDGPIKANARLIAAAPDLLKALKVLRNTLGDIRKGFSPAVDPARWVEQAQSHADAAIAKAEGRS